MRSYDWIKIPKFSQRNHLTLRWENLGIFNKSQPRIYFAHSQYNTFRGVIWKKLRLSEVLLHLQRQEPMTV
jgi:hypothetical protein